MSTPFSVQRRADPPSLGSSAHGGGWRRRMNSQRWEESSLVRYKSLEKEIEVIGSGQGGPDGLRELVDHVRNESLRVQAFFYDGCKTAQAQINRTRGALAAGQAGAAGQVSAVRDDLSSLQLHATFNIEALRKVIDKVVSALGGADARETTSEASRICQDFAASSRACISNLEKQLVDLEELCQPERKSAGKIGVHLRQRGALPRVFRSSGSDCHVIARAVMLVAALLASALTIYFFGRRIAAGLPGALRGLAELGLIGILFGAMAVVCDSYMMPASDKICARFGMSDDLAGVTLLAFASSAPEIVISIVGVLKHEFRASLSCVMGSGIIAFGLIPAVCVLGLSMPLRVDMGPIVRDLGFYVIVLTAILLISRDGRVSMLESGALCLGYLAYLGVVFVMNRLSGGFGFGDDEKDEESVLLEAGIHDRADVKYQAAAFGGPLSQNEQTCKGLGSTGDALSEYGSIALAEGNLGNVGLPGDEEVAVEEPQLDTSVNGVVRASLSRNPGFLERASAICEMVMAPIEWVLGWIIPDCEREGCESWFFATFLISLAFITALSEAIMVVTVDMSDLYGVPHEVSGVLVLALGAQVPDTLESLSMAKRGKGNGALSNAFSSQILNIIGGIALPYMLFTLISGHELEIQVAHIMTLGLPLAVLIALFFTLAAIKRTPKGAVMLGPREGYVFLAAYVLVTVGCTARLLWAAH